MLHVAVMAGVAYLRDVSKLLSIYMNGIYSCLDVSAIRRKPLSIYSISTYRILQSQQRQTPIGTSVDDHRLSGCCHEP